MKTLKLFVGALILAFSASFAMAQTNLASLNGSKIDVEGQNGKVVVLAIGASWLPLSDKQAEITNTLAKKYAHRDVVVYFVATDSMASGSKNFASADDIRKFAADNKLTVTVLRDPDAGAVRGRFKVEQVPSFVILDKNGKVSGEPFGGVSTKYDVTIPISKRIDALL